MLNEILNFVQTNIVHIGYWVVIAIFGFVIRSIVKSMTIGKKEEKDKPTLSKIKEKLKERFRKTGEPQTATKEEIDSLFPNKEERK